ncbi:metallophosphoesterase [Neobacillus sp. WH10]|uniref:metallophosphoesterase n=1 Tax=Neobacillus sp. WH10 TaxID=3047873 RepID=UPI0024C11935|nr:metallophosphoesterase [Neobacillus sp. WH10]WHY76929.1 metallophosphoesterase [Neobacillus sp. WH10]
MKKVFCLLTALGAITATALFSTNSKVQASERENPNIQLLVMSDVHVSSDTPDYKFANALQDSLDIAPNYDVLSIVGDLTNYGIEKEYDDFNKILNDHVEEEKPKVFAMGNHEYFESFYNKESVTTDKEMQQRFVDKTKMPGLYYDKWIKGYHFIVLAGEKGYDTLIEENPDVPHAFNYAYISDEQYEWFEKTIAENVEKNKPIFVFLHQPIKNTVYGSRWNAGYDEEKLLSIMKKYPQVIYFSGHSHYPIENQKSIIQNGITMVNTGSVKYGYDDINGNMDTSEGYVVNVFSDKVEFKARDYLNKKWIKTVEIPLAYDKWVNTKDGWKYYDQNGLVKTGWFKDNGKYYYLNTSGIMQIGWQNIGGKWYFFSPSGEMKTGWIKDHSAWYYMKPSGEMATGWVSDNSTWYYFKSNGAMATGWIQNGQNWFYLNSSGAMATGWIRDGQIWYYLKSSGAMATGWIRDSQDWFYLNSSGAMATGWILDGQNWFYFKPSGTMATGWISENGIRYYLNSNGALATG